MEMWSRSEWENVTNKSPVSVFYLYTPMCGTCAVASRMLEVISVMKPDLPMGKADLNYIQDVALDYEIESVPCLLITKDGVLQQKVYAFHSVPDLLTLLN